MLHGHRITRLQEVPWLHVPAGQNADGTLRDLRRIKGGEAGTQQRWEMVNEGIKSHADALGKHRSKSSVLHEYLEHVAGLPAPQDLQRPGGLKFAVMDVVISYGRSHKDPPTTPYMLQPTPIRLGPLPTTYRKVTVAKRSRAKHFTESNSPYKFVNITQNKAIQGPSSPSVPGTDVLDFTTLDRPSFNLPTVHPRQAAYEVDESNSPAARADRSPRSESNGFERKNSPLMTPTPAGRFRTPPTNELFQPLDGPPRKKQKRTSLMPTSSLTESCTSSPDVSPLGNLQRPAASISQRTVMPASASKPTKVPQKTYQGIPMQEQPQTHLIEKRKTRLFGGSSADIAYLTESERMKLVEQEAAESVTQNLEHTSDKLGIPPSGLTHRQGISTPKVIPRVFLDTDSEGDQSLMVVLRFSDKTKLVNLLRLQGAVEATASAEPDTEMEFAPTNPQKDAGSLEILTNAPQKKGACKTEGNVKSVWKPNPLHDDCVVAYANDSVRQIKAERGGQFLEAGILLGVRYILG